MNEFMVYTVYKNPNDYPTQYVVRQWISSNESLKCRGIFLANTYEGAVKSIPYGLYRMVRDEDDDPSILESWI